MVCFETIKARPEPIKKSAKSDRFTLKYFLSVIWDSILKIETISQGMLFLSEKKQATKKVACFGGPEILGI